MAKRKFKLTETERKGLQKAYHASKDAGTRTRYQVVRLYGEGYAEKEIKRITGCSRTSLMEWCRAYQAYPSQGLVDHRNGGNRAKLSKLQIEELQQKLHQYSPKEMFGARASTVDGQFRICLCIARCHCKRSMILARTKTNIVGSKAIQFALWARWCFIGQRS